MESHEQDDHRIDQPADGFGADAPGEQGAIGQGEAQVAGDQHRVERSAIGRRAPVGDHAHGFDCWRTHPGQVVQEPVFVERQMLDDFLGCQHLVAHPDEPHHMARDTAGKGDEMPMRPLRQGSVPGQSDQTCVRCRRQEAGHGSGQPLARRGGEHMHIVR